MTLYPLIITKVMDITEDCPHKKVSARQALLRYTESNRGPMVEIIDCYENGDGGLSLLYHIDDFGHEVPAVCTDIQFFAENLGLTLQELQALILLHQPDNAATAK